MGECILYGNGGSNPLNFKVICNPQPNTAKENTIWVDTDKINNYYFSATQPDNMVEYDLWFGIGTESSVAFSIDKDKSLMVYPLFVRQYNAGELISKTAKSYQGNTWVDWFKILYPGYDFEGYYRANVSITDDNLLYIKHSQSGYAGYAGTTGIIDITNINNIIIEYSLDVEHTSNYIGVNSKKPSSSSGWDAKLALGATGGTSIFNTVKLDVSAITGDMYIAFSVYGNLYLKTIYLEQ